MEWEHEGVCCIATLGMVALYGADKKRAFRHNINGDETASIAQSGIIDVPLALAHSQVSIVFEDTPLCPLSHLSCFIFVANHSFILVANIRINATGAHVP